MIRPSMVENLRELANDFSNYTWDDSSKTNFMVIGWERALEDPDKTVTWICEWIDEKKWYKRIMPVPEVNEVRKFGGPVYVSPQEFALIPRSIKLAAPVKDDVLLEHESSIGRGESLGESDKQHAFGQLDHLYALLDGMQQMQAQTMQQVENLKVVVASLIITLKGPSPLAPEAPAATAAGLSSASQGQGYWYQ